MNSKNVETFTILTLLAGAVYWLFSKKKALERVEIYFNSLKLNKAKSNAAGYEYIYIDGFIYVKNNENLNVSILGGNITLSSGETKIAYAGIGGAKIKPGETAAIFLEFKVNTAALIESGVDIFSNQSISNFNVAGEILTDLGAVKIFKKWN